MKRGGEMKKIHKKLMWIIAFLLLIVAALYYFTYNTKKEGLMQLPDALGIMNNKTLSDTEKINQLRTAVQALTGMTQTIPLQNDDGHSAEQVHDIKKKLQLAGASTTK